MSLENVFKKSKSLVISLNLIEHTYKQNKRVNRVKILTAYIGGLTL